MEPRMFSGRSRAKTQREKSFGKSTEREEGKGWGGYSSKFVSGGTQSGGRARASLEWEEKRDSVPVKEEEGVESLNSKAVSGEEGGDTEEQKQRILWSKNAALTLRNRDHGGVSHTEVKKRETLLRLPSARTQQPKIEEGKGWERGKGATL